MDDVTAGLPGLPRRPETVGRSYEFGGPEVYSFRQLLSLLMAALGRRRVLVRVPWTVAKLMGALLQHTPNPPLTLDQVRLLQTDKVVSGTEPTLAEAGVQPRCLEEFLPRLRAKYA